ncbi:pentapeptide repeat-containing protein [Aliiroseovarius sp. 2305UL8-7]|uniref:pentapeptide repeat-containing protein n=1 Tax=Aliiroseovarius conchicola TaxID=3121637 RepID=UPI0035271FAF
MTKTAVLLLCATFLVIGLTIGSSIHSGEISEFYVEYGGLVLVTVITILLIVAVILYVGVSIARSRLQFFSGEDDELSEDQTAASLVDLFNPKSTFAEKTRLEVLRKVSVSLIGWLLKKEAARLYFGFSAAVLGGMIGVATVMLLAEQNRKLERQNERILLQTDANIAQTILLEGVRRASANEEFLELLSEINSAASSELEECTSHRNAYDDAARDQPCWMNDGIRGDQRRYVFLTPELNARIDQFARRSEPYMVALPQSRTIDFDLPLRGQFRFVFLSPERGQLFEALIQNDVRIRSGDYSFAQLDGSDLSGAYVTGANLSSASLIEAQLHRAIFASVDFSLADLTGAYVGEAYVHDSSFAGGLLTEANFHGSTIGLGRFKGADMRRVNFSYSDIGESDFAEAQLDDASFSGVHFLLTDFSDASVEATDWSDAWAWSDEAPIGLQSPPPLYLCNPEVRLNTETPDLKDCDLLP